MRTIGRGHRRSLAGKACELLARLLVSPEGVDPREVLSQWPQQDSRLHRQAHANSMSRAPKALIRMVAHVTSVALLSPQLIPTKWIAAEELRLTYHIIYRNPF